MTETPSGLYLPDDDLPSHELSLPSRGRMRCRGGRRGERGPAVSGRGLELPQVPPYLVKTRSVMEVRPRRFSWGWGEAFVWKPWIGLELTRAHRGLAPSGRSRLGFAHRTF